MADDTLDHWDIFRRRIESWFLQKEDEIGPEAARQMAIWFASRCAYRLFPIVWESQNKNLIVPILWALTLSRLGDLKALFHKAIIASQNAQNSYSGSSRYPSVVKTAVRATVFCDVIIPSPHHIAIYSSTNASFAASFFLSFTNHHSACFRDLKWLENNDYKAQNPPSLWHDLSNKIIWKYYEFKQDWQHRQETAWSFFLDDYDRQLAGQEPDWKVLKALAHPDATEVWQTNDPQQISDYIRKIQDPEELPATESPSYYGPDSHNIPQSNPRSNPVLGPQSDFQTESHFDQLEEVARQTPIGARIDINPDTGLIEEISLTDSIDLQIQHAVAEIEEALDTFNDLGENMQALFQPARRRLERALDPKNRGANRLFSFVSKAHQKFIDVCSKEGLGDPRDDPNLHTTLLYLEEAISCLIFHEDVKPNIKPRIHAPTFHDALQIDNPDAKFHESIKLFIAAAEPDLAQELKQDQDIIQNPDEDEESKKDAYYYLIGRLVRGLKVAGVASVAGVTVLPPTLIALQDFLATPWGQALLNIIYRLFTGR